ncbi:hypothetical protein MPC4_240032 [Methylocella tundrae]|uniref:Uncharacterized protein n=1 Tax=Methylocella tundrae TaxID=227605 RepID=A0A8B6M5Z9_METTU|nr:hypothetical protein MPC4_240032 [Methylocella tundrae]
MSVCKKDGTAKSESGSAWEKRSVLAKSGGAERPEPALSLPMKSAEEAAGEDERERRERLISTAKGFGGCFIYCP